MLSPTFLTSTNKRRRLLLTPPLSPVLLPTPALKKRSTAPAKRQIPAREECGRLITVDRKGKRVLVIQNFVPFTIGRAADRDYCIPKPSVSGLHCKLYALTSDRGEIFVCLEDLSSNGTMWNDRRTQRETVILCDGDNIEIGGQSFCFRHSSPTSEEAPVARERVGHYLVLDRALGTGSFGVVHLAFNTRSLRQIACKKISRRRSDNQDRKEIIQREVHILKTLHHPNITSVEDVFVDAQFVFALPSSVNIYALTKLLQSSSNVFIELVSGGDLFSYLEKRGIIQAPEAKFIFFQVLRALEYLHFVKNVSHRDLKLENIIVAGAGPFPKVLIADFGAARFADHDFCSITGTLSYLSPEAILSYTRHGGYDGKRLDMWSSGIVLAYLLTGRHPFGAYYTTVPMLTASLCGESFLAALDAGRDETTDDNVVERYSGDGQTCSNVVNGACDFTNQTFGSEDPEARELLSTLLEHDPARRSTARAALASAWVSRSSVELDGLWRKVVERA